MAAARNVAEGGRLKRGTRLLAILLAALLSLTACSTGTPVSINGESTPLSETGEMVEGTEGEDLEATEGEDPEADGTEEGEEGEEAPAEEGEEGEEAPAEEGEGVDDAMMAASQLNDVPAASAMSATEWDTQGDFQVLGGTAGTDYSFASNILTITSSTPLTVKTTKTTAQTIDIKAGVKADLTLAGVNISTENRSPINMITNSMDTASGTKATHADQIRNKTTLYLSIADGTSNNLLFTRTADPDYDRGWPGIRCGWGSILVIDDSVTNIKKGGSKFNLDDIVTPVNGMIGSKVTLLNGTTLKKGDAIGKMDSATPGVLVAQGGFHSAGIGSGPSENSGTLIINGGDITAKMSNPTYDYNGSGIGGGGNGSGTVITINGGKIKAYGAGCGTAIGGGFGYHTVSHNGSTFKDDAIGVPNTINSYALSQGYSFWAVSTAPYTYSADNVNDFAGTNVQTGSTLSTHTVAGDITINGGYVYAKSGIHGNAIGQSCGHGPNTNRGHLIRITGGTVEAEVQTPGATNPYMFGIGARLGYTLVTGGSVKVQKGTSSAYNGRVLFQGIGGTAFNTQGVETWDDVVRIAGGEPVSNSGYTGKKLPDEDKVQMLEINLAEDIKAKNNNVLPDRVTITSWQLKIDNIPYDYGAPTYLDKGMAYVWVPNSATGKNVTVEMSYLGPDGEEYNLEPLYVEEVGGKSGSTLKRYIDIDVEKLPDDQKQYFSSLKKEYDGLTLAPFDIVSSPIDTTQFEAQGKTLNDASAVTTTYQLHDKIDGKAIADAVVGTEMPSDTGTFKVQLVSKQHATGTFANSYWGHRITGWAQITPVPAVLTLESAEWGHLDDAGNWTPTTSASSQAGNRVKVAFNLRSAVGTAPTCKTPTGQVQLKIDGKNFGKPITLTKEAIEKSKGSTYTVTEGAKDASANTEAAIASPDNRWTAHVVYYMDPSQADGLLNAKSTLKTTSKSDQAQTFAEVLASAMQDIMAATATLQAAEGESNEHEVTAEYLPDKNYIEGVEANPQNVDATATVIIPVDADATMTDDGGTKYEFIDEAPEGVTPIPEGIGGSVKYSSVTKNYADFHKKDADGNETIAKDYFTLDVNTDSAMPMEWIVSDPAVADLERDENGNVVYDENGNPKVHVYSCGDVTITMHQPGNAVYNENTRVIDMRIAPDNSIKPDTEARVIWKNLTRPGMPAAPGDEIEYTIVGSNLTDGSAWQDVNLGDMVPSNVTINPGSVQVSRNFGTPDDRDAMDAVDLEELEFEPLDGAQVTTNPDGSQIVANVGTIYGGQSTAMKFTVTVNPDIVDRAAMEGGNPPTIPNTPTASGSYGVKEAQDMAPGEEPGEPTPVDDTVIIGIPEDDVLRAAVMPKDPVLGGPDPDVWVTKTAENLSRQTGTTLPGDTVRYTITLGNKATDSCLYAPVIHDSIPKGVTPVAGSFKLTRVDGTQVPVEDKVYVAKTNAVALYVDDLYGGEQTTLTFECTVGDNASYVENLAQTIGTLPSDQWRGEHPDVAPLNLDDVTVVPDPDVAGTILGGILEQIPGTEPDPDDPDADDPEGGKPGVRIADVMPNGPLADAKKADPDDPTKPALTDPEDPASTTDDPILPGDRIVKFGDVNEPESPQDIAKELDRVIKETLANDPEATEAAIPVTVQRDNPEDPDNPIIENVIVTVPITPEMKDVVYPPAPEPIVPPVPGDPWTPVAGVATEDFPWDDFDWDEFIEKEGLPESQTPEPASPGVLIPATDPDLNTDLTVDKAAENLTRGSDGDTFVGDRVRYTVRVSNAKLGTTWFNAVVKDPLPKGIEIDMATATLVTALGQEVAVAPDAYKESTRILAVNIGDVPGGTTAMLTFEATVTEAAQGENVGNTATAYGTLPSQVDPADLQDGNRPVPGSAFDPAEGWDRFDETHASITNPSPAYPSKNAKDNGVRPSDKGDGNGAVGGTEGAGGIGGDGWGTGVAGKFLQLAQTGDPLTLAIASLMLIAGAAALCALITAFQRRRHRDDYYW